MKGIQSEIGYGLSCFCLPSVGNDEQQLLMNAFLCLPFICQCTCDTLMLTHIVLLKFYMEVPPAPIAQNLDGRFRWVSYLCYLVDEAGRRRKMSFSADYMT